MMGPGMHRRRYEMHDPCYEEEMYARRRREEERRRPECERMTNHTVSVDVEAQQDVERIAIVYDKATRKFRALTAADRPPCPGGRHQKVKDCAYTVHVDVRVRGAEKPTRYKARTACQACGLHPLSETGYPQVGGAPPPPVLAARVLLAPGESAHDTLVIYDPSMRTFRRGSERDRPACVPGHDPARCRPLGAYALRCVFETTGAGDDDKDGSRRVLLSTIGCLECGAHLFAEPRPTECLPVPVAPRPLRPGEAVQQGAEGPHWPPPAAFAFRPLPPGHPGLAHQQPEQAQRVQQGRGRGQQAPPSGPRVEPEPAIPPGGVRTVRFECERFIPFLGWNANAAGLGGRFVPDEQESTEQPPPPPSDELPHDPPPGHAWHDSEWAVDRRKGLAVDPDGWQYAIAFATHAWPPAAGSESAGLLTTRRRRWVRASAPAEP